MDAKFKITLDDNSTLSEINTICAKKIRVYNTDFVKDNLSWLHGENGDILPFSLIGAENIEIENKVKDINDQLGDREIVGSQYYKQNLIKTVIATTQNKREGIESEKNTLLTNKANKEIKIDAFLVKQGTNYNITQIAKEIDDIIDNNLNCFLSEKQKKEKIQLLKEDEKADISQLPKLGINFTKNIDQTYSLLSKTISLNKTLTEFLQNVVLQEWIDTGRGLHGDRDTCAFCGGNFTNERKKELDEHFSKESEELKRNINDELKNLTDTSILLSDFLLNNNLKVDSFYINLQKDFKEIEERWNKAIKKQKEQITILEEKLKQRLGNIFEPVLDTDFSGIRSELIDLTTYIDEFNRLIDKNNEKASTLSVGKEDSRKILRYNFIKQFIKDIGYRSKIKTITKAKKKESRLDVNLKKIAAKITTLESEKLQLEKELKDEGQAAEKINNHLKDFFGHDGLELKPYEEEKDTGKVLRFKVTRENTDAKNLSEGERSLIAFCYFMAKIDDEIKEPNAKDNLIIYIDDPISSLDNNHIFFMYSLIESITVGVSQANPKFCQLFISTHNLEFLKHLSNLHKFDNTYLKNRNNFIIEKRKKDSNYKSVLRRMPRYLRINISEYLYLFEEIQKLANGEDSIEDKIKYYEKNYTLLYTMGNIMRKFLECYISTKYPHIDSPFQNLNLLFPNSIPRQINRLVQEYSHLQWGERGRLPIDVPEAEETAKKIIEALKVNAPEHYQSLKSCIDKEE